METVLGCGSLGLSPEFFVLSFSTEFYTEFYILMPRADKVADMTARRLMSMPIAWEFYPFDDIDYCNVTYNHIFISYTLKPCQFVLLQRNRRKSEIFALWSEYWVGMGWKQNTDAYIEACF